MNKQWKKVFSGIKYRCKSQPSYFRKGIKCLITEDELKRLWFRDKAYLMDRPSIDRINSNGNYEYSNCRYLELSENCSNGRIVEECLRGHSLDKTAYIRITKQGYIQRSCIVCHRERQRKLQGCKKRLLGARSYAL